MVVAFSVKVPRPVENEAASQHVPIVSSSIIYKLMDTVTQKVAELLPPIIEKRVTGEATVLQLFDIGLKGKKTTQVGGCRVSNGVVEKSKLARVMRDGKSIFEGEQPVSRFTQFPGCGCADCNLAAFGPMYACRLNGFAYNWLQVVSIP